MKVLVTGNLGYIGTVMVPMLLAAGHEVHGMDVDLYERCTFGPESGITQVPTTIKDIRDAEVADFVGFDAVIHLAGLSNDPLGDFRPELTFDINYRASVRLAALAREAGVRRFLFTSSCSNYGAGGSDMLDEDGALNPVTPYGKSKVMAEGEVRALADERFCPVILRPATAYGLSPRLRFDLVINNLVAWAHSTGKIHIKSDGSPWRPVVHIQDISRAFLAALEAPRGVVFNQAFNVGRTGENYQVRDLANIVGQVIPKAQVEFAQGASPDTRNYRVSFEKIARVLPEFQPRWTAKLGAEQLRDAYLDHGVTLEEFEGPRYQRIAHIKQLIREGVLNEDLRKVGAPVGAK
ncbi:MAG TPA: NAD(P)-dependent oxidoreductase [Phycisphaerales bacterium]|nr:NAD(P)-dependent oxidoreductase [Phycisphaerales bacterium]